MYMMIQALPWTAVAGAMVCIHGSAVIARVILLAADQIWQKSGYFQVVFFALANLAAWHGEATA